MNAVKSTQYCYRTTVTMCLVKYHVLIFCLIMECYALNCRSDGGPKESELKSIYKKCLKIQQDGKNFTKGNSDQDWKESQSQVYNNNWDKGRMGNKENRNNRDDRMSSRGNMNTRDDMMGRNSGRMGSNDRMSGKSDRMGSNNDRSGSNNDRTGYSDRMGGRNDRYDNNDNSRDDRYGQNEYFNGRDEFPQSGEYGTGMSQYSNYHSTQSPRRYKREKRPENSGQRSQYNPNAHKVKGYEDFKSDEKNSTENSSKENDNKACALHCFFENLEMTGEDGMPDRYLVTHAITKDVKNEDLRDFLQESIEECFQILDNENSDEKCEFSKNLMVCLSEKGRSNCDDWKDDLKF